MQYLIVIEHGPTSFGAYVPDLPGCIAVGQTKQEAIELIRDAIELHLDDLKQTGEPIPEPRSHGELVEVSC
jgi:predicted RNase H-like HicB family nuclease